MPRRSSGRVVPLVVAACVALVLAGGGAAFFFMRAKTPKLCPGTPKLLASLRSPITVDAYVTRGLPKLDAFVQHLERLLAQYQADGAGHFQFHVIEVKDDDTKKHARELGLVEQPFSGGAEGDGPLVHGFLGLAFRYESQADVIKLLSPDNTSGLEFWIDNKVRELRAKAEGRAYRIGVLTGHGELPLSEANLVPPTAASPNVNLKSIITQNFPFYAFHDVDLHGGSAPIDPGLQGLIVTQPASDLTPAELGRIDDFVLAGKAVAFFVGAANLRRGDASMHATLSTHGLERLLGGYGIELGRDLVVDRDPKGAVGFPVSTTSGISHVELPFVPLVRDEDHRLDTSFPVFFRMNEVAFPVPSSLVVHREKQPDATLREVARTTPRAVRVAGPELDLHPLQPWSPAGAEGPVVLAVAEDGTLRGAFDASRRSAGHARVLVVASSQFLANPLARACCTGETVAGMPAASAGDPLAAVATPYAQQQLTSTILVFKNALDWLSFEDDFVDCSLLADAGR